MKFRVKQVPIESMEENKVYLNSVVRTTKEGVLQGPAILEYSNSTYGKDEVWKEVENTL